MCCLRLDGAHTVTPRAPASQPVVRYEGIIVVTAVEGQDLGWKAADLVVLPDSRLLTREAEILAARRLQAREYVRAGYVSESALTDEGTLNSATDPWVPYSSHFGAFDGQGILRATCRLISNAAPKRLPTLGLPTFDGVLRARFEGYSPGALAEIAALARHPRVGPEFPRALFRSLWLFAVERGVAAYVLSVDVLVLRTLRAMSHELFRVVGPQAPAPVRPVFPVWVDVAEIRQEIFTRGLGIRQIVLPVDTTDGAVLPASRG
jgi:hypothetical protein